MRLSAVFLLAGVLPALVSSFSGNAARADGRLTPEQETADPARARAAHPRKKQPAQEPALRPFDLPPSSSRELRLIPQGQRPLVPSFPSDLDWIRVSPLSLESLKGRVVLIEVWESSCVSCIRGLPFLSLLHARYSRQGLVVIGIHSPEFSFTAPRSSVERACRRFGIEIPVAADTHRTFWKTWGVRGWPTTYLLDPRGQLAYFHQGEFAPLLMERRVQALLREAWPQIRFPDPGQSAGIGFDPYGPECGFVTPEISTTPGLEFLLNREGYQSGESVVYADPGPARTEGTFFLKGPWLWLSDGLQRGAGPTTASIGITYRAKEVYAVLANLSQGPLEIEIRQDGKPLTEAVKGQDVEIASDGRSVLRLTESRLHYIVVNSDVGRHDLEMIPSSSAFQIHGFSFGNRCQTDFPHR